MCPSALEDALPPPSSGGFSCLPLALLVSEGMRGGGMCSAGLELVRGRVAPMGATAGMEGVDCVPAAAEC